MVTVAQRANLAVRFLLELVLLAAVASATWQVVQQPALRAPAVVVVLAAVGAAWTLLVHGKRVPPAVVVAAQLAALALGVAAAVRTAGPGPAAGLGLLAVVNAALLAAWNQ